MRNSRLYQRLGQAPEGGELAEAAETLIEVRKGQPCPTGWHAVAVESALMAQSKQCAPGPGPAFLPGEQGELLAAGVLKVAIPVALAFILYLIWRGATTPERAG